MIAAHPSTVQLSAFLLGRLHDPEDHEVEAHFADCDECRERALAAPAADTLTELLAAAQTRLDGERSVASTPAPEATPPAFAPTQAWGDAGSETLCDADVPPALANHPKYRVVRRLGTGGMGTVWLAEHAVMNRPVAIKVIRPDLLAKPGATARFLREVRAAAKLHHPNIVTAFDAEPAGDSCLLVMEYVPGETLADQAGAARLSVIEACRAVRDAAQGLAHAHAAGLVHRDVKPHNLIRAADGTTKVLDFGLAGVVAGEVAAAGGEGLTGAGMVVGTPDYIAPEQIADPRSADARADIYGLGCTLYHLLAGRPPMPDGTVEQKLAAHATHVADPILSLPPGLNAVLARMLAKRPEERYQSADEVATALESFTQAPRRRLPRWAAVAAGLLFVGLVAAAGVIIKIQRDNEVITVETNDRDVEIVMKRMGDLIGIRDSRTGETWEFNTLTSEIGLIDHPNGLTIQLPDKVPFVLRRNGTVVTITRNKVPDKGVLEKELALVVRAARGQLSTQEKELMLADEHPVLFQLRSEPERAAVELFASLPASARQSLLEAGYLKWRFSALDENRQKLLRTWYQLVLDKAEVDKVKVRPEWSMAALVGADVGFAVVDIPELGASVVSLYYQLADHPQTFWVTVVGKKAYGKPAYEKAHYQQLPAIRSKDYSKSVEEFARSAPAGTSLPKANLPGPAAVPGSDQERIIGTWRGVAVEMGGKPMPQQFIDMMKPTLTFTANKVTSKIGGESPRPFLAMAAAQGLIAPDAIAIVEKGGEGIYHLSSATSPKQIDMVTLGPIRKTALGLYSLEGDTLKLCLSVDPNKVAERPSEFATKTGEMRVIVTLKRERPAEPGDWTPLFNGKDLTGWKSNKNTRNWLVQDGVLIGRGQIQDQLIHEREFTNFHLRVEANINVGGNSGVLFRTNPGGCYEAEVAAAADHPNTGSLFQWHKPGAGLIHDAKNIKVPGGTWFTLEVIANGNHIVTKVNGQKAADLRDDSHRRGDIMLQIWGLDTFVQFRKIEIKELLPTPLSDDGLLQGNWAVTALEWGGKPYPPESLKGITGVVTGEKFRVELPSGFLKSVLNPLVAKALEKMPDLRSVEGTFTLDPRKTPKQFMGTCKSLGYLGMQGIYSLEGDTLRVCFAAVPEEKRPAEFTSRDGGVLLTLRRLPPEHDLFNSRDLTGWLPVGNLALWEARNGILRSMGVGNGWLRTVGEYDDFVLSLEYRLPPKGNSGVFLRAPSTGDVGGFKLLELQLLDDRAYDVPDKQHTGALFDIIPPKERVNSLVGAKWNQLEIRVDGRRIQATLNGKLVQDADLDKLTIPAHLKENASRPKGYIGLQCWKGAYVEFRNVRIRPLGPASSPIDR